MPAVSRPRARRVRSRTVRWAVVAAPGVVVARAAAQDVVAGRRVAAVAVRAPDVADRERGVVVRVAAVVAATAGRAAVTGAADGADRGRSVKAPIWSRTSSPSTASPRS